MATGAGGEPHRRLPRRPRRRPGDGGGRAADLHGLGPGRAAPPGAGRLQRLEGRADRHGQGPGAGPGARRHHGERRRSRVVRLAAGRGWKSDAERSAAITGHTAQRRWGAATDLAGAYQFLASGRLRPSSPAPCSASTAATCSMTADPGTTTGRGHHRSGRALGAAISGRLAGEPATDLVLSDVSGPSLDATVAGLRRGAGGRDRPRRRGRRRPGPSVVELAVERFGRLDVLISNAGVLSPNGRIHNLSTEDWERAFRVNVLGAVNGIRAAVPVMRAQRSGSIVLTASVSGAHRLVPRRAVLRDEGRGDPARQGGRGRVRPRRDPGELRVPGTFRSAIHDGLPPEALDAIEARHPLGLGAAGDLVGATRTSPATTPAGRPGRRWSSTGATRRPERGRPGCPG